MLLSRDIFKGERSHKLKDLCSRLNIPELQEHRALSDCIRTHLCYEAMREYCNEKGIVLPKEERENSKRNLPVEPEEFLELNEENVVTLSDPGFFAYLKLYQKYAEKYRTYVINISRLHGDNHDLSLEKLDEIHNKFTKVNEHVDFLLAEVERRKKRGINVPGSNIANPETSGNASKEIAKLNSFLSFWVLFLAVPTAIVGEVLLFLEMILPGAILFGVGALLLIVSYFNQ